MEVTEDEDPNRCSATSHFSYQSSSLSSSESTINNSFASLRSFKDWWKEQQGRVGREKGLRAQLQRLSLRHDFPSSVVIDAFLNPVVDRNLEAPQWGIPDLEAIRDFSLDKLKWNR